MSSCFNLVLLNRSGHFRTRLRSFDLLWFLQEAFYLYFFELLSIKWHFPTDLKTILFFKYIAKTHLSNFLRTQWPRQEAESRILNFCTVTYCSMFRLDVHVLFIYTSWLVWQVRFSAPDKINCVREPSPQFIVQKRCDIRYHVSFLTVHSRPEITLWLAGVEMIQTASWRQFIHATWPSWTSHSGLCNE